MRPNDRCFLVEQRLNERSAYMHNHQNRSEGLGSTLLYNGLLAALDLPRDQGQPVGRPAGRPAVRPTQKQKDTTPAVKTKWPFALKPLS